MTLSCFFFFSSRRRHTRCSRDWSSDVCSSDLRIFDLVADDEVMFFDSDMVCLNPWNPQRFAKPDALVAVAERLHSMVIKACRDWEIPVHEYFNAGLMILNRNCNHDWLQETERLV